jgi:hypothetical protein
MQSPKIFILLPDGIGLRNFAFTNFHQLGLENGFEITFWNATPFDLTKLGFNEIKIVNPKIHPITDLLKNAQIQIELNQNIKKSKDKVYNSYRFPFSYKGVKSTLKTLTVKWLIFWNNSESGLNRIRKNISKNERKTKLYFDSLATLQTENPAMVFCTNQRITNAVASILAAQDLGIPTATFIFSWDNLPKGTKIIETDYYFVWSEHMKNELQYYYPQVNENQIIVTGTPQFVPYFDKKIIESKETFYEKHHLDFNKKYICFSGDDVTTSPNDPQYLSDVVKAVKYLNANGNNIGILFRRCPVDFSKRFDSVLNENKDLITRLDPKWQKMGEGWNTILPTKDDLVLQINTIYHSELVINLGSSMVFDFVAYEKPSGFINYDVLNTEFPDWSVKKIYNFIHFRSMPTNNAVFWIDSTNTIAEIIEKMLTKDSKVTVAAAQKWFEKINQHPPEKASERIWNAIGEICKK